MRERFRRRAQRLVPRLRRSSPQGVAEGTFDDGRPGATAEILVALLLGVNLRATDLFLACHAGAVTFDDVERPSRPTRTRRAHPGPAPGSFPYRPTRPVRAWFD